VPEPSHAVFLSYASQDAEAAQKIAEALRAAGIAVWFDQSELRGGDVWDQKIRREIHECALFIPVVSANTTSRREGYFRFEWDLADQRSHRMARDQAFIVPVCLDATAGAGTDVPESFHRVQWTRLPGGEAPSEFVARIKRLLSPESSITARLPAGAGLSTSPLPAPMGRSTQLRRALRVAVALLFLTAFALLLINKPWISKPAVGVATSNATSSPGAESTAFNPPPHSIAVLPFVNIGGDKEQEYFSDGLTEELLNSLSRINELQVAARTSSFSFQGVHPDIATVAHKLNVASVLEGSVRRSGQTIRVTAQLNNAVTGFHLWSQTYDRDVGDILKLQTDIATAVATALRITLLSDLSATIELGGTRNSEAFDAYLRGSKAYSSQHHPDDLQSAVSGYTEAIRLDPAYALALAGRSMALEEVATLYQTGTAQRASFEKALADAQRAVGLAPELGDAHLALARVFEDGFFDFVRASDEYSHAVSLAPGNARVLQRYGYFAVNMGHPAEGLAASRRAVVLDPLSTESYRKLGEAQWVSRRYNEAVATFERVITLDPNDSRSYAWRGLAYYGLGDFQSALASCEADPGGGETGYTKACLALVLERLRRHADAEATFKRYRAEDGERAAYQYADIYAQWGDAAKALEWLQTALRLRDPGLGWLKMDPLMDPLRNEPRFRAIVGELKFPQ
jgi:TolB-like protein/tetratricopeptide (TPR) repeat protein